MCFSSLLWLESSEVYFWFCSNRLLSKKHFEIPIHHHRKISSLIAVLQSFSSCRQIPLSCVTPWTVICWTHHGFVDTRALSFRMGSALQYLGKFDKSLLSTDCNSLNENIHTYNVFCASEFSSMPPTTALEKHQWLCPCTSQSFYFALLPLTNPGLCQGFVSHKEVKFLTPGGS